MTGAPEQRLKAVIDTNVFVSAVIVPLGNPHRLLMAWQHGLFTLVTAPALIHEVDRVLHRARIQRQYGVTDEQVRDLVLKLRATTLPATPLAPPPIQPRHPKDAAFLAIAIAGAADYLITGDDDLLTLDGDPAPGMLRIVTVRDFLALLPPSF